MDETGDLVFEAVDLVGHVGVVEVQRGVGQVDHQLAGVLCLGEHFPEIARFHPSDHATPNSRSAATNVDAPITSRLADTSGMP